MTSKTDIITRRRFLRTSAIAGGTLMVQTSVVGAAIDALTAGATGSLPIVADPLRIRPIVVRRGPKAVAITRQYPLAPLAYFDKKASKIYVDIEYRDVIIDMLNATVDKEGVWTFEAASPVEMVKAKEEKYEKYDKTRPPEVGDCRIVNRSPTRVKWEFNCLPVYDSNPRVWWEGDAIEHDTCVGSEIKPGREDYRVVGVCKAHADPDCTRFVADLDVFNWVTTATS